MQTATVNETTLAYERHGEGEPVLLLHPGFVANAFAPLMREPSLAGHQLIAYHRRGYGESAPVQAPFDIAQHAVDCLALMDHLEITRAPGRPLVRRRCCPGGCTPGAGAGAEPGAA